MKQLQNIRKKVAYDESDHGNASLYCLLHFIFGNMPLEWEITCIKIFLLCPVSYFTKMGHIGSKVKWSQFVYFASRVGDHTISLVVPLDQKLELALDSVFSLGMQLLEPCECIICKCDKHAIDALFCWLLSYYMSAVHLLTFLFHVFVAPGMY